MPHPYSFRPYCLLIFLIFQFSVFSTSLASTKLLSEADQLVLDAPQVHATPSVAGTIAITWTSVAGATQYTVEYAKLPGTGFTSLKTVGSAVTSFRHTNLGYSEKLYYRVKATGAGGVVSYSNEVSATTHPATYSYRIMPIGDSNTDGGSSSVARGDRASYRHELYRLLVNSKYKVDMVGSEVSGTNLAAAFKQKNGYDPDVNHAGFGGAKNEDIEAILKNGVNGNGPYLDQYKPEVILLHIGTNSLGYPNIITALNGILDQVDAYEARSKQEVTVILAQIIKQCNDCNATEDRVYWDTYHTTRYNRDLVQLANQRIAAGDRIILVDMAESAGINYSVNADMADYLHPNQAGFDKMAPVWFNPLKELLTIKDTHAPETQIVSGPAATTNSKSASFTLNSNEPGVTYQASLDGAAFTAIASPATFNNLPDGTHTIKIRAVDASGNADESPASYTWTIDATPPAPPVLTAVTEDRGPSATDLTTSDNTLKIKGTAEANSVVTISLSGKGVLGTVTATNAGAWEFNYETTALAEGNHTFTATAADAQGNSSTAGNNLIVIVDQTAPAATLTTTATSPVNAPFQVKLSFSEPVFGLAAADVAVANGTVSNLVSADLKTYTATISPASDGKVTVQLAGGKVTDLAGNANTASGLLELTSDVTKPKVTITSDAVAVLNAPFDIKINFSEPVTGFDLADISVTNGGGASELVKVSTTEYTAKIAPSAQGEVAVTIAAGATQDAASNSNEASNRLTRVFDTVAPTGYAIAFGVEQVNVTNERNISLTVTGAEAGATYTYSITSTNGGPTIDGSGKATGASVSIPALDLSKLKDGTLTVTFYLTDAAGNKGAAVNAQVEKITRDIAAVTASGMVKVPFGTPFENVVLPQKVRVTYTTAEEDFLDVTWEKGNYNPIVAGQYTITGKLKLAQNITNFGNKTGSIIVEVQPNQPPTALNLSATQFKPDTESTDVIGTFATEDPEDTEFTYTLVSGEGDEHNSYFFITDNQLHLTSNKGLSGITKFQVRVQSKDPYNNTIERAFVLTKLPYDNKRIELVNAFSPDGDGINDTWTTPELRFYDQVEITVMDRSGVQLYHSTNPEQGWDGKGKNGQVQQGPYFYIIQVKDINLVQKGVVTVLK